MSVITFNPVVISQQPWPMQPWKVLTYQAWGVDSVKWAVCGGGEVWHKAQTTTEREWNVTRNLSLWDADSNNVLPSRNRILHKAHCENDVWTVCDIVKELPRVAEPLKTQMSDKSDISVQRVVLKHVWLVVSRPEREKEWLQIFIFHPWPVIWQTAFLTFFKVCWEQEKVCALFWVDWLILNSYISLVSHWETDITRSGDAKGGVKCASR